MYYAPQGINKIFWQAAKSEHHDDILDNIKYSIQEYTGNEISDRELLYLVWSCYSDFNSHYPIPKHLTDALFKSIYGDPVLEMVYGEDTRPLSEKIIMGVLAVLRHSKVQELNIVLINFGQSDDKKVFKRLNK